MQTQFRELTDSQCGSPPGQVIKAFLPVQGTKKHDLRVIMNAILWLVRTGVQWRHLESKYPPWQSVYYHFYRWSRNGTLEKINHALNKLVRLQAGRAALPSLMCVDSQSVKLSPFIAQHRGIDANKKINGRKRQAAVDTLGLLWAVKVHAAHQADCQVGCQLWSQLLPVSERLEKVLIDASYQGSFTQIADSMALVTEIATRPETAQGFVPLKQRWVVERSFAWSMHSASNFFRRIVKDYEYTKESSQAMLVLANTTIALNKMAT
jgi:transposase